jgi:hypothetical protein
MFQEYGINKRTQKITSPSSYPSSFLSPAVSSGAARELLSIRDEIKVTIWRIRTCVNNKSYKNSRDSAVGFVITAHLTFTLLK